MSAACPYCGVEIDPPPTRRRKCPHCVEVIHTRTDRNRRKKYLLTADQAEEHERAEAERKAADQAEAEQRRRDAELEARREREIRWKELSHAVQTAMKSGDWGSLQGAYQQQAYILFSEGRPYRHVAEEARRAELMRMYEAGIPGVRMRSASDERVCEYCASLDGRVFTVEEALEKMPLPGPSCTDGIEQNPHGGFCRCVYIPVIPGVER